MILLEVLLHLLALNDNTLRLRYDLYAVNSSPHQPTLIRVSVVKHFPTLAPTYYGNNGISLAITPSLLIVSSNSSTSVEKRVDKFRIIGGVKG